MDRPSRQKMGKEILNLNYALDQGALIDIHRTFYQLAAEYTCFSSTHRTFSKSRSYNSQQILANLRTQKS